MFTINDDNSIYATRGDIVFFGVTAHDDDGNPYKFQAGDVLRIKVYGKKDAETVVMQKDFPVTEVCENVEIFLSEEDTKIGEVISKPKDYWYEVELNPYDNPQTIIGYDEDGPKVFKLFPEGDDIPEWTPEPEDIPVVDEELDMASTRPIQNQAVARAVANLAAGYEKVFAAVAELHVTPEMFGAIGDGEADDTEAFAAALASGGIIHCDRSKTYYFGGDPIVHRSPVIRFDGNNCTLLNFCIHINVEPDSNNWINEYPNPDSYFKNVHLKNVDRTFAVHLGTTISFSNIIFRNYDNAVYTVDNYMDFISFDNIMIKEHYGTDYLLNVRNLGDQLTLNRVHITGSDNDQVLTTSGRNSCYMVQCLNGQYAFGSSDVSIVACHFESGSKISHKNGVLHFDGCYFWSGVDIPMNAHYTACKFMYNLQTMEGGYNGINPYALDTTACQVWCDSSTISGDSRLLLDEFISGNNSSVYSLDTCVPFHGVQESSRETWKAETGDYTYTVYPSVSPHTINNMHTEHSVSTIQVNIASVNKYVYLMMDSNRVGNTFLHIYRTHSSGTVEKVVVKPSTMKVYDYGECLNGVPWVGVDALPVLVNSECYLKSNIYVNTNSEKGINGTGIFIYANGAITLQ